MCRRARRLLRSSERIISWQRLFTVRPTIAPAQWHHSACPLTTRGPSSLVNVSPLPPHVIRVARPHASRRRTADKVEASKRAEAEAKFKKVSAAHSVLVDEGERRAYDEQLRRGGSEAGGVAGGGARSAQTRGGTRNAPSQSPPSVPPAGADDHRSRARSRLQSLSGLRSLRNELDAFQRLRRHLLLAIYDSRSRACNIALFNAVQYPFPFAHYSQTWHGIWWEDILLPAAHDVSAALLSGGERCPAFACPAQPSHPCPACPAFASPAQPSHHLSRWAADWSVRHANRCALPNMSSVPSLICQVYPP